MKFECVKISRLKIYGIFHVRSNIEDYRDIQYILAKYVITQIHACREESEPGLCQILIWLKRSSMKNKMRMIKAAIGVRCVSCFVGPPPTLNLFDNPVVPSYF